MSKEDVVAVAEISAAQAATYATFYDDENRVCRSRKNCAFDCLEGKRF